MTTPIHIIPRDDEINVRPGTRPGDVWIEFDPVDETTRPVRLNLSFKQVCKLSQQLEAAIRKVR